ncbi:MAG: type II CAAX endopeptidase family protein [Pseudomonadota bacterium]
MNTVISKSRQHPMIIMVIALVFYLIWFCAPALVAGAAPGEGQGIDGAEDMVRQMIPEIGLVITILAFVALLNGWHAMRITTQLRKGWFWALILPLVYVGIFLFLGYATLLENELGLSAIPLQIFAPLIFTTFLVGVFEEFLFRGVVFNAFERWRGTILAVIVSSILFGSMHYVNWAGGQPLGSTHIQVLHAGLAGILYAGLMLYTGSIWIPVLYHGLWDSTVTFFQTASSFSEETASVAATDSDGSFVQYAVFGFEPMYGALLVFLWWRSTRKKKTE